MVVVCHIDVHALYADLHMDGFINNKSVLHNH